MFIKPVAAGLAGTALFATVAFGQTPTPAPANDSANMASATISDSALHGDWRTSKVVGLNVYNDDNESVGSINDLLIDKNGNTKAVVLGVGGLLGVGTHLVAVPFDKIKFVNEPIPLAGVAGAPGASGASTGTRPPPSTTTGAATGLSAGPRTDPWYPDHAVFNATKDQLKAMPEFKYSAE